MRSLTCYPQAEDTPWRRRHRYVTLRCVQEVLAEMVGSILSAERGRARLSQAQLADRAGLSQQLVSQLERGTANATFATVQRIFATLGKQLRVEAVPLGADLDVDIDRFLRATEGNREQLGSHGALLRRLREVPFAVTGWLGAVVQGAPMLSPDWIDILVASQDLDALAAVMEKSFCMRWNAKWQDWGYGPTDPREPGALRWRIHLSDMRLQIVDQLPPTMKLRVGEFVLRVVPIAQIEREDPWLHRLMTRWRQRPESFLTGRKVV